MTPAEALTRRAGADENARAAAEALDVVFELVDQSVNAPIEAPRAGGDNEGYEGSVNGLTAAARAAAAGDRREQDGSLVIAEWVGLDDPRVAGWLEARWEADVDTGSFACPLPRHRGTALLVHRRGGLRVGCCTGRWRSVAEVFAAQRYRCDAKRSNVELAAWSRLIAHLAGVFEPALVHVPALPEDASPAARRARDGFALLVALRWADHPPRPVPFTVRFASAWCKMGHAQAHAGIRELITAGVIHETGRTGWSDRVRLYLPGETAATALARYGGDPC